MAFDKRKALQNALTFTQQGKWDKAIAEYQVILRADAHDLTVCNNLGDLYARVGKSAEAIELYLKLGELYRADGLAVKAIAVFKKIMKLDATRTQAQLACADLYAEQGLTGEAKIQLATAAEHYAKVGDTAKVIEIYQRLATLDPTNHGLLRKLGDLLLSEGKKEEAATQYKLAAEAAEAAGQGAEKKRLLAKVRELAPGSIPADSALAEQLLQDGKHAEAVDALLKITASDATNAKGWCLLGEAYLGLRRGSEAINALERAVSLGLPEAEGRPFLAKAFVLVGRTDEGITLCRQLAEDALSRKNPDEAIASCQGLLALSPNLTPIHAFLVKLLQSLGREEEARTATWALAAAHESCGETEAAIHVYHQLLERDPSDAEAKARLEALESAPPQVEREELAIPGIDAAPARQVESQRARRKPAPAEPPALELSGENALTPGEAGALDLGEGLTPDARSPQVFELDESGEMAGFRHPSREGGGAPLEGAAGLDVAGIELPGESLAGLEAGGGEEETSGEAAELLAEAEVYLKYGLAEKARERLLEVVRLAPENVAGHRRLKALYLERPQVEEACGEILAIAQILHMRGQREAAQRELQEGLRLAPGHAALERLLAEVSGTAGAAPAPARASGGVAPAVEASEVGGEAGLGGGMTPLPGEELLPELQDLLEEPGESPRPVGEVGEADVDQAMKDDLAEAEFYLSQGMVEEARAVHRRMRLRNASHPSVARLGKQLGASAPAEVPASAAPQPSGVTSFADLLDETAPGPTPPAQAPPPEAVTPKFSVMDGDGEAGAEGFVNLGAELEEELAAEETGGSAPAGAPELEDILREFQKGVHEHLDEKDFETHYNLGIAYKEMDLHDEAIEEFRLAARDPGRALACTELLGLCYQAKADPEAAIREFRAGLEIRGHPRGAYHSLRYNLGSAYETQGDLRGALESFEALQAEDPHFRDVSTRVQELRERLPVAAVPTAVPASPGQTGEHAKRGRDKKISFI